MSKKLNLWTIMWFLLSVFVFFTAVSLDMAFASDDDDRSGSVSVGGQDQSQVQSQNQTASAHVTDSSVVSQNVAGSNYSSRAYGFSHSLGDVDINQCIVSKQTGTFIVSWQGYDYNLWCMGEVFDAKGLFKMGAEMRCDIKPIASKFEFREKCLEANTVDQEVTESPQLTDLYNKYAQFDEHWEDEEEHDQKLDRALEEQAMILERLEQYEARVGSRVAQAYITEEQKVAIKEVLKQ